jgi:uncharacterized surface protein with fasciclin (FAS1) repeats
MTKRMRTLLSVTAGLFVLTLAFAPAQAHCGKCGAGEAHAAHTDIVDTAMEAGSFNTLVAAVKAAGLVETLKGEGPFTVFAPTDEAFAALPEGTVENLLKPENKDQLVAILTYHVVAGEVSAKSAKKLEKAETVNGESFNVKYDGKKLMVGDATVVKADIETSNGIIHVIDKVLIPSSTASR